MCDFMKHKMFKQDKTVVCARNCDKAWKTSFRNCNNSRFLLSVFTGKACRSIDLFVIKKREGLTMGDDRSRSQRCDFPLEKKGQPLCFILCQLLIADNFNSCISDHLHQIFPYSDSFMIQLCDFCTYFLNLLRWCHAGS